MRNEFYSRNVAHFRFLHFQTQEIVKYNLFDMFKLFLKFLINFPVIIIFLLSYKLLIKCLLLI